MVPWYLSLIALAEPEVVCLALVQVSPQVGRALGELQVPVEPGRAQAEPRALVEPEQGQAEPQEQVAPVGVSDEPLVPGEQEQVLDELQVWAVRVQA